VTRKEINLRLRVVSSCLDAARAALALKRMGARVPRIPAPHILKRKITTYERARAELRRELKGAR
jgi:hypothetical protein